MAGEEIEPPPRKSGRSRSTRAGLTFPVGRIARILKHGKYADRIGYAAPVYQAAILEYLAREVLELAGNAAIDNNRRRISPRHIQLAVRSDTELSKLMGHVIFSRTGWTSSAQVQPLRKKAASSGTKKAAASSGSTTAAASSRTTKAAASSGTTKAAASSDTTKASSWGTEKLGSWGAKKPASSSGTTKSAASSGTTKAASWGTEKLGSWGAKKPASSRTKKGDKK